MKLQALCRRTTWEIVRDPLNLAFGLGFPLVLLLLLSAIQANVPVDLFAIDRLTPGISVFGLAFIALFSATLVARDRESALLQRLYTAPLTAGDFIFGYVLPLAPMAAVQAAVCYLAAIPLGLTVSVRMIWAVLLDLPAALLFIGLLGSPFMLRLLNTKDDLLPGAILYLRVYFLGMPALALYNFGNAVFSSIGDTKKPLLYLSIAGALNILLNLFFVIVCNLDVAGVALASAISQCVSAGLILHALTKVQDCYALHFREAKLDPAMTKSILALGLPAGFQNAIFAIANLFIQAGVNSFDSLMVKGNSAAANADNMIYDCMAAFYMACASFMSQNYGAGKPDRVKKSYFISLAYSFGVGLALGGGLFLFGRQFLALFTTEAAVIDAGMKRVGVMGLAYCISAFMDCTIAASRGLGKTVMPTVIVIMGSCVFRVIWVYTIFAHFHTIPSLYLLYPCSWALTAIAEILYFIHCYKQAMKIFREPIPSSL
mgnify:CR=1 FL=1